MNIPSLLKRSTLVFGLASATFLNAADRPNVLLITVDDLKPLIGAYGYDEVPTPNMDRLAERGTVMMHNQCQQAICAPSRMSTYTGLRPDSTKVWDLRTQIDDANPDAVTMQQWFKEAGYTTAGAGKLMHGARNEHPASWSEGYTKKQDLPFNADYPIPAHDNGYYQNEKSQEVYQELEAKNVKDWKVRFSYLKDHDAMPSTECLDIPDDAYVDGALATWADEQLEQYSKSKEPFFLSVGFTKPHLPFVAPKKYWDMFDREKIPLAEFREHAANSPDYAYHMFGELRSYTDIPNGWHDPITDDKQRELIHAYFACVAYVDAQIGKILDTLEQTGLSKNTIVVLWGDHGYHLGDHGLWNKHTNFEQATFAPLIISAPGYNGNQKSESMSEMVDIFPTLVDLAGLDAPYKLEGKSLVPVLKDPSVSVKDYAISQYPRQGGRMGYAIRTPRYRMVMWMKNDWRSTMPYDAKNVEAVELYDYDTDPLEKVSLANDPAYAEVVKDLTAKMREYFAEYEQAPVASKAAPQKSPNFTELHPVSNGNLFEFSELTPEQFYLRFATVKVTNDGLDVNFENVPKWPSVEFIAPEGQAWDITGYNGIDIDITNNSPYEVRTVGWMANPGDDQSSPKRNAQRMDIGANQRVTLHVPVNPKQYALDLTNIKTIRIFVDKLQGPVDYTIHSVKVSGNGTTAAPKASAAPKPKAAQSAPKAAAPATSGDGVRPDASGNLLDLSNVNALRTDLRFTSVSNAQGGVEMDFELSPKWPSVEFYPGNKVNWNLSGYNYVDASITNLGSTAEKVFIYLSNPPVGSAKKVTCGSGRVDVGPGETKTIRLDLNATPGFDLTKVDAFRVFTGKHTAPVKLQLNSLKAVQ